jgi:hypothetical protein
MERGARAFYRRRRGEETGNAVKGIEGGVISGLGRYSGEKSGLRRKKVSVLTRGPLLSAR